MNYTMNPNCAIFNGIKDKIVLNNEKAISHADQFFFFRYLANKGIGGEIRQAILNFVCYGLGCFSYQLSYILHNIGQGSSLITRCFLRLSNSEFTQ